MGEDPTLDEEGHQSIVEENVFKGQNYNLPLRFAHLRGVKGCGGKKRKN